MNEDGCVVIFCHIRSYLVIFGRYSLTANEIVNLAEQDTLSSTICRSGLCAVDLMVKCISLSVMVQFVTDGIG